MKNIYPFVLSCFLLSACSKDSFKDYDNRIIGTWNLVDVDRSGVGGSISNQTFQYGQFTFREDGSVSYTLPSGTLYEGGWDIQKGWRTGNCYTNDDGYTQCDTERQHELFISVTDPVSQHVKNERFDDIQFTSSNRFKAYIFSDFQTYTFIFRR
jgi:hypothetical protein